MKETCIFVASFLAFWSTSGLCEPQMIERLEGDLEILAGEIGERNLHNYESLEAARLFLLSEFVRAGYEPKQQVYEVDGREVANIYVEIKGTEESRGTLVIGAHYDSVEGSPGANDNGSGVVALLEVARQLKSMSPLANVHLVAFTNEEPPYFQTEAMGSLVYANSLARRDEKVIAMISLETMGYYSDERYSQNYPFPLSLFYPDTGNFLGIVGDRRSQSLVDEVYDTFDTLDIIPVERASLPDLLPGIGWSDHWSFWQNGWRGIMMTDTAPYRYPHYHTEDDTPDKVQYDKLALVVKGLMEVLKQY
jgi:Zn-dependent M28 family amino/carboxypeptidase